MRFYLLTLLLVFLLQQSVHADGVLVRIRFTSQDATREPPTQGLPLSDSDVATLAAYQNVRVGLIHWVFDGTSENVPEVDLEFDGLRKIFGTYYGFPVDDIAIPKNNDTAQSYLESAVTTFYTKVNAPSSLAILVYGGHGKEDGLWYSGSFTKVSIDWPAINSNIVSQKSADTFQILDSCYAGVTVSPKHLFPDQWPGTHQFWFLGAVGDKQVTGSCQSAFTKAVISSLTPSDPTNPVAFTPQTLYAALPPSGQDFPYTDPNGVTHNYALRAGYNPKFWELAVSEEVPKFKIAKNIVCPAPRRRRRAVFTF